MGQRGKFTCAAGKDAKKKPEKEDYARDMGQRVITTDVHGYIEIKNKNDLTVAGRSREG